MVSRTWTPVDPGGSQSVVDQNRSELPFGRDKTATNGVDWERRWAPYDEATYQAVLKHVRPDDVILDIGAGDLRLAKRLARRAKQVYAVEVNGALFPIDETWPANLQIICKDAYRFPFPPGITLAVLLMRHCRNFGRLADKLKATGCRRLATNARWGFGLEIVDLQAPRVPYSNLSMGWYACWCGATGFVPGPAEHLTPALETVVHEVCDCPACYL